MYIQLCSVEHFFDISFIKIRFSRSNVLTRGESNLMKKMLKKCSTGLRFIRKRNTTYKIGTLASACFERSHNYTKDLCGS